MANRWKPALSDLQRFHEEAAGRVSRCRALQKLPPLDSVTFD